MRSFSTDVVMVYAVHEVGATIQIMTASGTTEIAAPRYMLTSEELSETY